MEAEERANVGTRQRNVSVVTGGWKRQGTEFTASDGSVSLILSQWN